ncbi:MAG: 50S ribosomal protein L18, partial [Thermoplasmata archaeon HGW-Thermoplasmata-2]
MADSPIYRVAFRRRREGKTDYRARLALLKSGEARLVVRPTLKSVIVQFINYNEQGDNVVASATAKELAKFGWKGATSNIPAAYLAGLLAAKRASGTGVKEAVFDIGMHRPQAGGVLFAVLKGAVDGGIEIPHDAEMIPEDARIRGGHIKSMDKGMFDAVKQSVLLMKPTIKKEEKK